MVNLDSRCKISSNKNKIYESVFNGEYLPSKHVDNFARSGTSPARLHGDAPILTVFGQIWGFSLVFFQMLQEQLRQDTAVERKIEDYCYKCEEKMCFKFTVSPIFYATKFE